MSNDIQKVNMNKNDKKQQKVGGIFKSNSNWIANDNFICKYTTMLDQITLKEKYTFLLTV